MAWETAPSTVAGDVALGALGADTVTKSDACRLHDPPPILGTRLTVGMRQKVGGEHRVDDSVCVCGYNAMSARYRVRSV